MPTGIYKRKENWKPWNKGIKGAGFWTGKHLSEETKKKLSLSHTGKKLTEEHKRKVIEKLKGRPVSKETREKIRKANLGHHRGLGRKFSNETRIKMSLAQKGEKGSNWKGGINSINKYIVKDIQWKLWREEVFKRDNWICQKTGKKGGKLHPHHINNFSQYPELRFDVKNGITLSVESHRLFHKIYGKQNNTRKQLDEFLKL